MKKIGTGLLAGVIMLSIGMLIGQFFQFLFPRLKTEYENQNLFRPWEDPLMSLYFIEPFLTGIILMWIWEMVKESIKSHDIIGKGLRFGFVYWMVTIPGMVMSYGSFPVSLLLVCSWSITILIQALCSGMLYSKILK